MSDRTSILLRRLVFPFVLIAFAVALNTGLHPGRAAAAEEPVRYFYAENGERRGPVLSSDIPSLIDTGLITPETLVWTSGMTDWARADSIPDLAALFTPPEQQQPPANVTAESIRLPAIGPNLTEAENSKVAMVLGATLGILFHEFGHALIGEIGVPSTGPEEDAVDEFSALLLSTALSPAELAEEDMALQMLLFSIVQYSTMVWYYDDQVRDREGFPVPWYDAHSDSGNRFRNTFCLIYGAASHTYTPLADWIQFPQEERDRCLYDYPRRFKAWQTITAPYIRDDGSGIAANQPATTPGGRIPVVFEPSATGTGQLLLPVFKESGIFEAIAAVMEQAFVWPRDLTLVFSDCGEANAFYDPNVIQIQMCWEGVEFFAGRVLDGEGISRN